MQEDYLWDKKGTDPAIEALENSLRVFRFDDDRSGIAAPEIKAIKGIGFFTAWSLGFAAAAACVAIALTTWVVSDRPPVAETASEVPHQTRATMQSSATVSPTVEIADTAPAKTEIGVRITMRKTQLPLGKKSRRPVSIATKANGTKPAAVQLTEEEIYAYNRLVLALSITSEKLNLVSEKITFE